ncbi:MAG: hypothetical protein PHZ17_01690 [Sulfurovum sp.]|nr:hypothetical protein [Sulfurovum sp.]
MKKMLMMAMMILALSGCAPIENTTQDMTLFLKKVDYSAFYKASPRTKDTGLKVYGGLNYGELDYIMEKPYGIKIIDKVERSGFKVEIKNILTGETGYVKIGDLTKMTPNEVASMNRELKGIKQKREQKTAQKLNAIFQLANTLNNTFYPCPKGGAHDTVHYLGIEPMGDNHYRKHYRCSKCGQYYYRTY